MKKTVNFNKYLNDKYADGKISVHYDAVAAKETNVIGAKLAQARKDRDLNQQELRDLLTEYGVVVQKAAISKWEKGENVPNAYQLLAICAALRIKEGFRYFIGDIDLNPIRTDLIAENLNPAGRKLVSQFADYLVSTGKYHPVTKDSPYIVYRDFPVYEIGASAGPGQLLSNDPPELRSFPSDSIPEDADFAVRVAGTSMEPVFTNGQYVWVQQCDSLENGEVGIFEWNGESYIKVYREQIPENKDAFIDSEGVVHPQVVLISYNTANGENPPKVIQPGDSFKIFGRVLRNS